MNEWKNERVLEVEKLRLQTTDDNDMECPIPQVNGIGSSGVWQTKTLVVWICFVTGALQWQSRTAQPLHKKTPYGQVNKFKNLIFIEHGLLYLQRAATL